MASDKNKTGEYALYDKGKLIGYAAVDTIDGTRVVAEIKPIIVAMKAAAKKDKIDLILISGLRTQSEQLFLRKQNVIDKEKKNDTKFLIAADSSRFFPKTGKPGFSNHQDGKAYDFKVNGLPKVYAWLVKNAYRFGFIRTVDSERWHWEFMPKVINPFAYVGFTHPSWDGLAPDLAKLATSVRAAQIKKVAVQAKDKTVETVTENKETIGIGLGVGAVLATIFYFKLFRKPSKEKKAA